MANFIVFARFENRICFRNCSRLADLIQTYCTDLPCNNRCCRGHIRQLNCTWHLSCLHSLPTKQLLSISDCTDTWHSSNLPTRQVVRLHIFLLSPFRHCWTCKRLCASERLLHTRLNTKIVSHCYCSMNSESTVNFKVYLAPRSRKPLRWTVG